MPMFRQWGIVVAQIPLPGFPDNHTGTAFGFMLADVDEQGALRRVSLFGQEVSPNNPPTPLITLDGTEVLVAVKCSREEYLGQDVLYLTGRKADEGGELEPAAPGEGLRPGEVEGQPEAAAEQPSTDEAPAEGEPEGAGV